MNTNPADKITLLEQRLEQLSIAFERYVGISLNPEASTTNIVLLQNKAILLSLAREIEDIEDYDVALETLNQQGNEKGVEFKRGIQKQLKGESPYERSIICRFTDRNKEKHILTEKAGTTKEEKTYIKNVNCPVFYRFSVTNGKIVLNRCYEEHNHPLFLGNQKKLTAPMITDISSFSRKSKVIEIKDFLEAKYDTRLDYMSIYHQLRLYQPRFNINDCQYFLNYLIKQETSFRTVISEESQSLTKLEFDFVYLLFGFSNFLYFIILFHFILFR